MSDEAKISAIDEHAAIQKMQKERGWEVLMKRYAVKGDELLTKILDIQTDKDLRQLYVFQLKSLGALSEVLRDVEAEAKLELQRNKEPQHKGN